jgi:hypothetical protein
VLSSASALAQAALLTPQDVGAGFTAQSYTPSRGGSTLCGGRSPDDTVNPPVLVGTRLINADGIAVLEEIRVYNNATDAKKALDLAKAAVNCSQASDGTATYSVGAPKDVASEIGAEQAFGVDASSDEGEIAFVAARQGAAIASLQFTAPTGSNSSAVDSLTVTKTAVKKLK